MIQVKILNESNNGLPQYATEGSAGMDLQASIKEDIRIEPFCRVLITTGISIELPIGYEAQIRPRSGLALKNGITVANTPGTIDANYRGEIKVILSNISNEAFYVHNGDRIAQMVIAKYERVDWLELKDEHQFTETERGKGGFGHTGL